MTEGIDIALIKSDSSVPKDVLEVYESLSAYMKATERDKWKEKRKLAWRAVADNEMWDDGEKEEMKKKKQVPLVVNKLNKGVQGSAATATANRPGLHVLPIGSGDLYVAELLQRGVLHIWDKNNGGAALYDFVEEMKTGGIGFIEASLNLSKGVFGKIEFNEDNPEDYFWSPRSRKADLSDTPIIKAKLRTKSYIKDHYEDVTDDDLKFQRQLKDDESQKSSGVTGADNYAESEKTKDAGKGQSDLEPEEIWEIGAWMLKTVKEHWLVELDDTGGVADARPLEDKELESIKKELKGKIKAEGLTEIEPDRRYLWKRKLEKREYRLIVGKKMIDKKENPYGIDADGNPVLPIITRKHNRTLNGYPTCPTFFALDINKEKNKARMQYNFAVAHLTSAPIREPSGCKWEGTPGSPDSRVIVPRDAAFPPDRMQPGSMDLGLILQREQKADQDINDQYDLQDVSTGKLPGDEKMAWRAIWALQEAAGTMSQPFIGYKFEPAIVDLGKCLLAIAIRHWPRQQWERLLEEKEWTQFLPEQEKNRLQAEAAKQEQELDMNNPEMQNQIREKWEAALQAIQDQKVDLLKYDVKVQAGSTMPTSRTAKKQEAIELTTAGIYDQQAALEYIDDPMKDEIIERTKAMQKEAMADAMAKTMK